MYALVRLASIHHGMWFCPSVSYLGLYAPETSRPRMPPTGWSGVQGRPLPNTPRQPRRSRGHHHRPLLGSQSLHTLRDSVKPMRVTASILSCLINTSISSSHSPILFLHSCRRCCTTSFHHCLCLPEAVVVLYCTVRPMGGSPSVPPPCPA